MPRLERDQIRPTDSPPDATREAPAPSEPISDADESVAHIAALVRRTSERRATPGPAPSVGPDVTAVPPPPVTPQVSGPQVPAPTVTTPQVPAPRATEPVDTLITGTDHHGSHTTMPRPSRRVLISAAVLVVALISGFALLTLWDPFGADQTSPPASTLAAQAPSGYAVKATDVTSDCAGHSRGKTRESFEAENCVTATRQLAIGVVGGRPVLFVVARIEMATAEAAASVKQVLDGNGTGNLNDLLRDGKTYPGAPQQMPVSGYASVQVGTVVAVAEAGFVDEGRSSSADPALRAAAAEVAAMVSSRG